MAKFIIKRLVLMLVVVLGVTMLSFFVMYLAPGDPARLIAAARYGSTTGWEQIAAIGKEEGLNTPVCVQYAKWLGHICRGDLGNSLISGQPVLGDIFARFPATLQLALVSMLISLLIALPLGVGAAVKRGSLLDHLCMAMTLTGVSMPNFWLGILLILLFSVYLGWLPVFGKGGPESLVLPAVTLGIPQAAVIARLVRSNLLEVLKQNYIRTARAEGLAEVLVIFKYALKNALIPAVTIVGLQLAFLLEGAVVVETVFAWPGIGKLLVDSILSRDYAMIEGCVLLIAVMLTIINLLVDISYVYLDPRIRYGAPRNFR